MFWFSTRCVTGQIILVFFSLWLREVSRNQNKTKRFTRQRQKQTGRNFALHHVTLNFSKHPLYCCFCFLLFSRVLIVTLNSPSHIQTKDLLYTCQRNKNKLNWMFCLLLLCRAHRNKIPDSVHFSFFTYITLFCSFSKYVYRPCLHFAHFLSRKHCHFLV